MKIQEDEEELGVVQFWLSKASSSPVLSLPSSLHCKDSKFHLYAIKHLISSCLILLFLVLCPSSCNPYLFTFQTGSGSALSVGCSITNCLEIGDRRTIASKQKWLLNCNYRRSGSSVSGWSGGRVFARCISSVSCCVMERSVEE